MSNKTLTIKRVRQSYTIVEILVVIALMAILMGIGTSGINTVMAKRGLKGAVSVMSSQVNLARSVAVARNLYVALLLPEPFSGKTANNNNFKPFFCNRMRLCLVKPSTLPGEFDFVGWIEEYDWIQLPTKTCAHPINEEDYATLGSDRLSYLVDLIKDVPVFSDNTKVDSTGIVFAPSGRLASYNDVMIQIYTALPNANAAGRPDMRDLGIKFTDHIQGNSSFTMLTDTKLPYRRWCVSIKKLTGRTEVTYAQPAEK